VFTHTRTVALACALSALFAAPAAAEWRRLDSPNFIVVGDIGAKDLGRIAAQFESFRGTLSRILSDRATATAVPTVVIVFPDERAFAPFQRLFEGKPVDSAGAFHGDRDFNFIAILNDGRPGGMRVVFHEYAHLVISNITMNLPVWLEEGLAEYYSTFETGRDGREATIGRPIESHLRILGRVQPLPIEQLVGVDRSSPLYNEGLRRSIFYAQSWALAHMLLSTPKGSEKVTELIGHLDAGIESREAWQRMFESAVVQRDLQGYIRRRWFNTRRYTFAEKLAAIDATASPMPAAAAQALLASLYLRQRRYDDAARLAENVLKKDENHGLANAVAARVDIERGDLVGAMARLGLLEPDDDWFVAYSTGVVLSELVTRTTGPASERIEAARRQFAAVLPRREMANVHAHLAMLELASPLGEPARAASSIRRARQLAPGRDDYALVDARVLAELGEFAAARRIFEALMAPGFPPHIRDTAKSWLANTARMETSRMRGIPRTTAGYRARQPGEERLEGLLEGIVCPAAAPTAFRLRTAHGVETLFAMELGTVQFITYRRDLKGKVMCGALKEPLPVFVTWKGGNDPAMRIVVAVEFLPQR
jgi:tetratricopeptide (TPR) repeat protein